MKKIIGLIILIVVVLIIVLIVTSGTTDKQQATPFKIGVLLPLTGESSVSGEKLLQGIRLAEKEIDPQQITLVVEDTHTEVKDAVTAAKKLMEVDKVNVLIGVYVPDEVVAIAPLAKEKGITIFSASFCSDSFKEFDNVFCGYPGALDQLHTVISEIKKRQVKQVALVNTNDDFGMSSRDAMVTLAGEGGYSIALNELVPFGNKDLKTSADKVLASKADSVFMASGDTSQAFTLMKLLSERGYKGTRITFVDIDKKALKDFGSTVEGTLAPGIAPNKFSADFTEKYTKEYNKVPEDYVVALGYDVAKVVTGVMSQETFDSKNFVSQAINFDYKTPAIKGFRYKEDHSVNFGLELWQAKGGEYVAVE